MPAIEKDRSYIRITLIIAAIVSFVSTFTSNALNLGISQISREFMIDQYLLNWTVTGYILPHAAFLLPFGRLADVIGRKRIYAGGMLFFSVMSLGCGIASSFPVLLICRIFQGIASAMIFGNSMAVLTSVVPPAERGRAMGLTTAVTYLGLAVGPVLGGFICDHLNWRFIFYLISGISAVAFCLAGIKLKDDRRNNKSDRFDVPGSLLWVPGILLFLFGVSDISEGFIYILCALFGIIVLAMFFVREKRTPSPVLPVGAFLGNRVFAFSSLAALISYSATFAVTFLLSLYLQSVRRLGISESGLILLAQPVVMAVVSPFAGRLSDRIDSRVPASAGMGITALGLLFFVFLNRETSVLPIVLNLAFLGLGFGLFASPNNNAIMGSVDKEFFGLASSTVGTARLLGQAFSMTAVALITSLYMKNMTFDSPGYAEGLMKSSRVSFAVFTIFCLTGVFVSLAGIGLSRRRRRSGGAAPDTGKKRG